MKFFQNLVLMLILIGLGLFLLAFSLETTGLSCNKSGSCYRYTYIPIINNVLAKQELYLDGLGSNDYEATCHKKVSSLSRNGKKSKKVQYELIWQKSHGSTMYNKVKLHNYTLLSQCKIDSLKINSVNTSQNLKIVFGKSWLEYIVALFGLLFVIGGLLVPFGVVRVSSKEELAELENNPEYQQKAQETKQAVEDFVQKHGDTIKNIERGISSNADNIQTILRILRNFGIKL